MMRTERAQQVHTWETFGIWKLHERLHTHRTFALEQAVLNKKVCALRDSCRAL